MAPHLHRRRRSSRGLTVIEVCVMVTVVAILVAMAIPGFGVVAQKPNWKNATQIAKGLGNVFSAYAADNDQHYPDGATSTALFNALLTAKYLPNADCIYIAGAPGKEKASGHGPLTAANVCWDITGLDDAPGHAVGVNSSADDNLPLAFSTGNTTGLRFPPPGGPGVPFELTLSPESIFGQTGVVVLYKSMGAKFVKADPAHRGMTLGFMSKDHADPVPYTVRNP